MSQDAVQAALPIGTYWPITKEEGFSTTVKDVAVPNATHSRSLCSLFATASRS